MAMGRQDFPRPSDPFSLAGNKFEHCFYSNVCDSYPGYGYTGSNLENMWLQQEIRLRP